MIAPTNRLPPPDEVDPGTLLPALRQIHQPKVVRRMSRGLMICLMLLPPFLMLMPWWQYVEGKGRLIAFRAEERPQTITAPIEGRIVKWYKNEGEVVKEGEEIVDIIDNDPEIIERINLELQAAHERLKNAQARQRQLAEQLEELTKARTQAIGAAANRVRIAKQQKVTVQRTLDAAIALQIVTERQYTRMEKLFKDGKLPLASRRELEVAEGDFLRAKADVAKAEALLTAADESISLAEAEQARVQFDTKAGINAAEANLKGAQADVAGFRQAIYPLEVRLARQNTMKIKAPCTGRMFRVEAPSSMGGQLVKAGEPLAMIVPQMTDPVVEMVIDGNDAPLVSVGAHVRLQFEGWPAVQFVGWPSLAVGTVGGRVRQIDPADTGAGQYRILVEPQKYFDNDEWPPLEQMETYEELMSHQHGTLLRQGNRANGWVFILNEHGEPQRVSLGWELWRRLNGFPPIVAPYAPKDKDKSKGKDDKTKPPLGRLAK